MGEQARGRRGDLIERLLGALLTALPVVAAGLLVVVPVSGVVWRSAGLTPVDSDGSTLGAAVLLPAVVRTLLAAGMIAALATGMAVPWAWLLRTARRRARLMGALGLAPMLLPSYLAFAGWTLLRAPMTPLGDWIMRAPPWVPDWAAIGTGVWGLALWSWPLAMVAMGSAARRIDQSVLDALDLDGASRVRRLGVVARLMVPGIVAAFLLVLLTMTGSMVAMDVSRLETYSVTLLRWVQAHPSDLPVWRASWPLVLIALAAGTAILRVTRGRDAEAAESSSPTPARGGRGLTVTAACTVWGLSVVAPFCLFVLSLREPPHAATLATIRHFLAAFVRDSGNAVLASLSVAARVGAVAFVVSFSVLYVAGSGRGGRRLVAACAMLLMLTGLVPGVLVGTALRRTIDMTFPAIGNSSWIVVAAHLMRFAFLGVILSLWLSGRESRVERDLRAIDGAMGVCGFWHGVAARQWGALLGGALATGILSFHEIESTVITWPPGVRNLSQEILDALHFSRDERLGAAAVTLMGAGVAVAILAAWLTMGGREDDATARGARAQGAAARDSS